MELPAATVSDISALTPAFAVSGVETPNVPQAIAKVTADTLIR
jgi:hypothetical protein